MTGARPIAVFAGASLLLAVSCRERRAAPAPLIPEAPPVEVAWQDHIAAGKYATFAALAGALRRGTALSSSIQAFEFLLRDPARLDRVRLWAAKLDGPERGRALPILYAELMLADSDPDILYECAQVDIERAFRSAAEKPVNHGQYFSWVLSRPQLACLIGYEATGQERFLELMADSFERTLPLRDSELGRVDEVRGRAMHNWGTDKYALDGRYSAEITTAGRVTWPMARWIAIVGAEPRLRERFGPRAARFLEEVRRTIDDYETEYSTVPGTEQGYYQHMTRRNVEPLNHMAWAGNCLLTLGQITGEEKYHRMASGIAAYFKASMWIDERGCCVWTYMPQPDDRRHLEPEWVWKARTTIDLPLYFAEHGTVFTGQDLRMIARTFLTNVHRGDGRWSARITADFDDLESHRGGGGLLRVTPWIRLDRFEPRVREVIEELVATRPDAGGWLRNSHGIVAYAHRLRNPGFNAGRPAETLTFPRRAPPAG